MSFTLAPFKQDLNWFKTLREYYNRPEWELYDLKHDPLEMYNVAEKPSYKVMIWYDAF